jgi:uncharacterized protein YggU (UPF0235/DUF167 family)
VWGGVKTRQTITIKVIPNTKENNIKEKIDLFGNTIYKIKTTAKTKDSEANEAVIEIIAKHFKIAKRDVNIANGLSSRVKVVEII